MSLNEAMRQKTGVTPDLAAGRRGEASRPAGQAAEASGVGQATESLAGCEQLMEKVCKRENLFRALAQVKRNRGAAGVDGMGVQQLSEYLKEHWPAIRERLLAGQYQP